jgi:hypothetical protein
MPSGGMRMSEKLAIVIASGLTHSALLRRAFSEAIPPKALRAEIASQKPLAMTGCPQREMHPTRSMSLTGRDIRTTIESER